MISKLLWSGGEFMLEMLIALTAYNLNSVKSKCKIQPESQTVVSRETLNRARANSNAETAFERATQARKGSKVVACRPSWLNMARLGAWVEDTRDLMAAATVCLSREFEFHSQMEQTHGFSRSQLERENPQKQRVKDYPLQVTTHGITNEHIQSRGRDFGTTTPLNREVADDLSNRISSLLNDKSWEEVPKCCVPEPETTTQTEMMRWATTGVVGDTASEGFSAYLQRAFEAEEQRQEREREDTEMKNRTAALDIIQEAPEPDYNPSTRYIREKARRFLRELCENPMPDLKVLVNGFASLHEITTPAREGAAHESYPSVKAPDTVAVLHTNPDAL